MTWFPANNQYDGANSQPVNYAELNSPFYIWDLRYVTVSSTQIFAPLLTTDSGAGGGVDPQTGERLSCVRAMVVPPDPGRCC